MLSRPQELREAIICLDLVPNSGQGENPDQNFVSNASKTKGFLMEAMFDCKRPKVDLRLGAYVRPLRSKWRPDLKSTQKNTYMMSRGAR